MLPQVQRVKVDDLPGINWRIVGWSDNTPPVPVIYVGTHGPRQKAVIHLVDPASGWCSAVVKVPLQAAASAAIARESVVLADLEEESCKVAPRLIYFDEVRGIATQRFLAGRSGNRKLLPEYLDLLQSLVLPDEHTTLAGHAAEWRGHPLWDFMEPAELELLTSALAELVDATSLPACWAHGDFAPWNIRDRKHLPPALIDWETGERGALPLQDALHFLHIQRFLFRGQPKSYAADLAPLAKRIGVSSRLSRKLEIAYLSKSYFTCMEWGDRWRADYLLKSVLTVMHENSRSTVYGSNRHQLRLVTSRPANHRAARFELFSALVAELNRTSVPYCILSGHENTLESNTSDVDIMFRPRDLKRVPAILARCADASGARLVQAIRHETSACYFVLARPQGKHVAHLAVDCYGDYRRDDRTWLLAEDVVANRRRHRDFYRPAIADEFIYRLVKKVLKQSVSENHLKRLQHLFARDAAACRDRLSRFWSETTALSLECKLVEQNLGWFQENLPALSQELWRSHNAEGLVRRVCAGVCNTGRLLKRIWFPTGMLVSIRGDGSARAGKLAERLLCSLAPAFRRIEKLAPQTLVPSFRHDFRVQAARIRSSLVIEAIDGDPGAALGIFSSRAGSHFFPQPDLILRLDNNSGSAGQREPRGVVFLEPGVFSDQTAEQANIAVLNWLEARTARRLKIAPSDFKPVTCPSPEELQPAVECEFAGSD